MFRATTKEGKVVKGWYCKVKIEDEGHHYIIPFDANTSEGNIEFLKSFYRIDPCALAQDTTVKDKNNEPIYGSFPVEGKMSKGGDRVKCHSGWWDGIVSWQSEGSVGWCIEPLEKNKHRGRYGLNANDIFEVIPKESKV